MSSPQNSLSVIEGETHQMDVTTNREFTRVEWTAGAHTWTDETPGTTSRFEYTYDDLGATTGARVTVTAVAFAADATSASSSRTVTVWSASTSIDAAYIGPYSGGFETAEGEANALYLSTDVGFSKVDWHVNGKYIETEYGPSTLSIFSYDYPGLGSPTGKNAYVQATAYSISDGTSDVAKDRSDIVTMTIWGPSDSIEFTTTVLSKHAVLENQEFKATVRTDVGFDRVEWYIDGSLEETDSYRPPYTESVFTHSFPEGSGSSAAIGQPYTIKAVAYSIGNGDSVEWENTVSVHSDKGAEVRFLYADVGSLMYSHPFCTAYTYHTIRYYCDESGRTVDLISDIEWYGEPTNDARDSLGSRTSRHPFSLNVAYDDDFFTTDELAIFFDNVLWEGWYLGVEATSRVDPAQWDRTIPEFSRSSVLRKYPGQWHPGYNSPYSND